MTLRYFYVTEEYKTRITPAKSFDIRFSCWNRSFCLHIFNYMINALKRQQRNPAAAIHSSWPIRNENEITSHFESRFIMSDYVEKRQEYSSMPTFSQLVRQATRLSKTRNLFSARTKMAFFANFCVNSKF